METDGQPLLEIKNLQVIRDRRTVLDVPYLAIYRGEMLAIMGPNGAGKSTLLQTLALLLKPARGHIRIGDIEATARGQNLVVLRRRMAMVFQEPLLLDMTVAENVRVGLKLRQVPAAETRQRIDNWLQRFGIAHLARVEARHLSGGEAQRTSLARAFALEPEVLLLDEPFSALDPPTRAEIVYSLAHILRETGQTTLFVTHDRNEALTLGDRVGVILAGHLAQVGLPTQVFAEPANAEVAAFLGIENILAGRIQTQEEGLAWVQITPNGENSSPPGDAAGSPVIEAVSDLPVNTGVLACIQAEDITLTLDKGEIPDENREALSLPEDAGNSAKRSRMPHTSARNCLAGRVSHLELNGPLVRVTVQCGSANQVFPLCVLITRRSLSELELQPGQPVLLTFKASGVYLILHGA